MLGTIGDPKAPAPLRRRAPRAASRIGYSEEMGRMCSHMGMGAPGFTETALQFHRTADTIGTAAKQRDAPARFAGAGPWLNFGFSRWWRDWRRGMAA